MKSATSSQMAFGSVVSRRLVARLREQTEEIEDALYASASALTEQVETEIDSPEYHVGRRAAITELVDYAVLCLERAPGEPELPVPLAAAVQVRRAARLGVSLSTVMRRYVAGERVFAKFVMDGFEDLPAAALWEILAGRAPGFDGLLEVVASEYAHELGRINRFPEMRLRKCVDRLLAGDLSAPIEDLGYDLDGWHIGVVITGIRPEVSLRSLAAHLGCDPLTVPHDDGVVWGWLGAASPLPAAEAERVALANLPEDVRVAIGESSKGLAGWRLTHREAMAGFHVMLHRPQKVLRGSKVMLLAAVLRDDGLADAMRHRYIAPLAAGDDEGQMLQQTLRAYFSTGGNAVTAAAVLDVNRQTVQRRLRKVEQRLGFHLPACQAELEVALDLEELHASAAQQRKNMLNEESILDQV